MFYKLSDLIPISILRSGAPDSLRAAYILKFWPEVALEVFRRKDAADCLKAVSVKQGKLKIQAPDQSWATETRLRSGNIIAVYNKKLGKNIINSVSTKVEN